jgi:hypothetical protein
MGDKRNVYKILVKKTRGWGHLEYLGLDEKKVLGLSETERDSMEYIHGWKEHQMLKFC